MNGIGLKPGDALILRAGGGGGFGPPGKRDPTRLAEDVHHGYVSAQAAAQAYGGVMTVDGKVDVEATRTRRLAADG